MNEIQKNKLNKIVVFGNILPEGLKKLYENYEVVNYLENTIESEEEFLKKVSDAVAIITWFTHKINKSIIEKLNNVRVIANYAVGYDNIDIKAATSAGIVVLNTPDILTNATAEIAVLLTFACAKRAKEAILSVLTGNLDDVSPSFMLGKDIIGKTVGVIGAGRIGKRYAIMMQALGCNVIYYNRSKKEELEKIDIKYAELEDLLKTSDIVSLHLPLNEQSKNLLDMHKLSMMKDDAILVNTARAAIIDEKALINLLEKGKFFSVGLDVYNNEPYPDPKLLEFPNVIILPHIGSATYETRLKMAEFLSETLIIALNGRLTELKNLVNKEILGQ
ncbi:MAG: D-glycerate dehydrogenase [Spirochaetales bacterium]|nr:D-glycerate dehydrogenase [Spirochaetales bacterium]